MPRVIKIQRDVKYPPNTKRVDRTTQWGNPFRVGPDGSRQEVVAKFSAYLKGLEGWREWVEELRGYNLACWCHDWDGLGENPMYCHADVLLALANQDGQDGDETS